MPVNRVVAVKALRRVDGHILVLGFMADAVYQQLYNYGLYSYGLYSYGLCSYGFMAGAVYRRL